MANILVFVIVCLICAFFVGWGAWGWHVNSKFNKCAAAWKQAWRIDKDESKAWECYHAEELANEDMLEMNPFAWKRKWSRDYLAESKRKAVRP